MEQMNKKTFIDHFPIAAVDSHKTQNGRLTVIAGSGMISGAALFNLKAASTMGCGYIHAVIEPLQLGILAPQCPWVLYHADLKTWQSDAAIIGGGCEERADFEKLTRQILESDIPVVIDAYALRLIARKSLSASLTPKHILTPHLGEFSELSGLSIERILFDPLNAAVNYAKENQITLVLKGTHTIVTDGKDTMINTTGNQGLAKAGSGDVLAGLIGGLAARGVDSLTAAKMAVWIHGLAAERCAQRYSITTMQPTDLIDEIRLILHDWRL